MVGSSWSSRLSEYAGLRGVFILALALAVVTLVSVDMREADAHAGEDSGAGQTVGDKALRLNAPSLDYLGLLPWDDQSVIVPDGSILATSGIENATPGGFTSDSVEYVGSFDFPDGDGGAEVPGFPELATSTGASIFGDKMVMTSWKSISMYDISDPLDPEQTAYLPTEFMFENEDVSTNGEIMLFSEELPDSQLHVYDISDPSKIEEIATLEGAGDHTTQCILGCDFSYGSDGSIVDLRDPSSPKLLKRNWHEMTGLNGDGAHSVEEYRPGFLVTSPISDDMQILDVRDPLNPKVLARGEHPDPQDFLFHSGDWPRNGRDDFLLMQGEKNFQPQCDSTQGPFMTYDATKVRDDGSRRFTYIDRYRVENGAYADGAPAVNGLGCSSHWFEEHRTFRNGGLVALAYYEHGTHFLNVGDDGQIERVGYFLPNGGSTSAAYWITDRIVYSVDYIRGVDILRFKGEITQGPPDEPSRSSCTVTGTNRGEVLSGTSRADVICGLAGNDVIRGLGGDDTVRGGTGNDVLTGDAGRDRVYGQDGGDQLRVKDDAAGDLADGGAGTDTCASDRGDTRRSCETS